jgi:replicative DNA helicase
MVDSSGLTLNVPINVDNEGLIITNAIKSVRFRSIFVKKVNFLDFRYPQYQSICWAIQELESKQIPFEVDTLIVKACSSPVRPGVITYEFISSMLDTYPLLQDDTVFEYHIHVLKTDSIKAKIADLALSSLYRACLDPKADISVIKEQLDSMSEVARSGILSGLSEFLTMDQAVQQYEENKLKKQFRTTGFLQLDKMLTEGLGDGKITIVCGLPGMGKSSFALSMMRNLSYRSIPTAQFALEMDNTSIVTKLLAFNSNIAVKKIVKEYSMFSDVERKIIDHELHRLRENKYIFLNDAPAQSLEKIREQIMILQDRLQQQYIVVVIDLFGKIKDFYGADNFARTYEQKLNECQVIARELGVNLCLVAQINREASKRKDYKRPKMSDLKNSGAFEEVADLILGIHRPHYHPESSDPSHNLHYNEEGEVEDYVDLSLEKNIAEVIIMKQRMGLANVVINFYFNPLTTRYTPVSEDYQEFINQLKEMNSTVNQFEEDEY